LGCHLVMSSMLKSVAAVTVATVASSNVASLVGKYRIKGYNGECLTDALGFTACDSVDAQTWTFAGDNDEVTSLSQHTCIDAGLGGGEWGDVTLTDCTKKNIRPAVDSDGPQSAVIKRRWLYVRIEPSQQATGFAIWWLLHGGV